MSMAVTVEIKNHLPITPETQEASLTTHIPAKRFTKSVQETNLTTDKNPTRGQEFFAGTLLEWGRNTITLVAANPNTASVCQIPIPGRNPKPKILLLDTEQIARAAQTIEVLQQIQDSPLYLHLRLDPNGLKINPEGISCPITVAKFTIDHHVTWQERFPDSPPESTITFTREELLKILKDFPAPPTDPKFTTRIVIVGRNTWGKLTVRQEYFSSETQSYYNLGGTYALDTQGLPPTSASLIFEQLLTLVSNTQRETLTMETRKQPDPIVFKSPDGEFRHAIRPLLCNIPTVP